MKEKKNDCQYFKNGNLCAAVLENEEAKAARRLTCENDEETACCYLCSFQKTCDISCRYLGENQSEPERKGKEEKVAESESPRVLRCHSCGLKMRPARTKLRIGGWEGITKTAVRQIFGEGVSELGEMEEELLPIIVYLCPKCGRMELVAEEKAKEKLLRLFNLSLM